MPPKLSAEIQRRTDSLFSGEDRETATRLLADLQEGFSKVEEGAFGLERVQSSALKVSHGNLDRLSKAIAVGQRDYRDLLTAAGFTNLESHKKWLPKPGKGSWWERLREWLFGIR